MKPQFHRVLGFFAVLTAPVLASGQTGDGALPPPPASADSAAEGREIPLLNAEQLDELLGPIALYPDALIAILLPASTMPTDLVLAARYLGANGDSTKVDSQPWDESVRALAHYPEVLKWMDEKLSWSIMVGDAFVAQPVDVMQSIQRLRARARAAGTLVDSAEQKVVEDEGNIRIVPAQPEVIYVPVYDPQVVYVSRPSWSWGYYSPVVTYRWCYPTGIWLSYDCDWYSWRVWCVNPHWRHDWYYRRAWYAPYPHSPRHHYDNHDYGHGWNPRRGGGHPDYRRGGRDDSTHVVIRDGHRVYPRSPDFGGARGGDRHNGGNYVEDERRDSGGRNPGGPDRRRDDNYADGRNGSRSPGAGDRPGRDNENGRPDTRSPGSSPRNPPVVRDSQPDTTPAPRPGRWIDRATNPGNRTPAQTEPSRSRPTPSAPPVVTRPETPRNPPPAVRTPDANSSPAPRPGRWVDRAANPGTPPPVRAESPRSRPAPSAPRVAPSPSPSPAPERSQVVRIPVAGGGSRSVVVNPPAERSAPRSEPRAERPQRGGDNSERQSGRRRSNDG